MKIKFTNALILTSPTEPIISGELVVENENIIFIGKTYDKSVNQTIDCNQNLIMPGFINCHAHSAMTLFKGVSDSDTLENWLGKVNNLEKTLTAEQVYNGTICAIKEYVKNGITIVQDCYFYPDAAAKAFIDCGMRAFVALSQNYSITEFLSSEQLEQLYLSLKDKSSLVDYVFYCHSTYTCNERQFANIISLARKYNKLLATHMSETLYEVGSCAKINGGKTPAMLLESYGFFDSKCLVAHGVHLQKEDYAILKKYDVSVIHNPSSNLKLGSGIANLKSLIDNDINICLGTDGSASNNKLDMFREMFLSSVLQKYLLANPSLIEPSRALSFALTSGAKALNCNKIGSLKVGNFADLIMIDMHSTNNQICNDIKSNLVYACGTEDVILTMINGKILYQNGEFVGEFLKNYKIKV